MHDTSDPPIELRNEAADPRTPPERLHELAQNPGSPRSSRATPPSTATC